jgi:RsiW-degrading membrane proteinase PrsW (M82 family)
MLVFAYLVYWADRYEHEPAILLGGVFAWGAVVAAGGSFIINTVLGFGVYSLTTSESLANLATGIIIAPIVEESLKGFAVLMVFIVFRNELDSILDGIIYAAVTALGFAATENIYYIYNYGYIQGGVPGLIWLAFLRIILVGWQHPFYTAFIGIGLAIARLSKTDWEKIIIPLIGFTLAFITHAFHNLFSQLTQGLNGLAIGTLFDWSGWGAMLFFMLWALSREQSWLVKYLYDEISIGTISTSQYQTACSGWRQLHARYTALLSGQYRLTNRFYITAAELAYKKHQLLTLGDERGNLQIINQLRSDLAQLSSQV